MKKLIKKYKVISKNQKGVTLIELLLYMGLLSILLVVLTELFVSVIDIQLESEATSSLDQDGRYVISRLVYDINRATSITTPAAIGQTGNTLTLVINGTTHTYALSTTTLQISDGTGTYNLNNNETAVSNISFRRLGNAGGKNLIKVQFTLTSKTLRKGGAETQVFTTTAGIR